MQRLQEARRPIALVLALIGWIALAVQLNLTIGTAVANGKPVLASLIVLACFFTILTNITATVCLTLSFISQSALQPRPSLMTAVALYISVVGIVYALLLRRLWQPHGMQLVTDVLLHDVMPIAFVLFWLLLVPKGGLRWRAPLAWLVYPLAYLAFIIVRGALTGVYPYPFIDVATLGYRTAFWNALGLTFVFTGLGFLLVIVDRILGMPKRTTQRSELPVRLSA